MRYFILSLFFILNYLSAQEKYEISIVSIFQNEAPYLKEWIDYHLKIGVDHFYLYNNESTDDFNKVLMPYIYSGIVEVTEWPKINAVFDADCQNGSYRDALSKHGKKTKWLCIIDTDEFILPMTKYDLKKQLKSYPKECKAIYGTWLQFGTGGVNIGPGPILRHLTKCASRDHVWCGIWKVIVQPKYVETCEDCHHCILKEGYKYYNGDGEIGHPGITWKHYDKLIRINHYTYRDEWCFWNQKVPRWFNNEESLRINIQKNEDYGKETNYDIFRILDK